MAVQSNGQIKLSEVVDVLGGTASPKISDYYLGGAYVEDTPQHSAVPASGEVKISHLYSLDAVTFAIAGAASVNETDTPTTYTVTTTGFSAGTTGTLYWTLNGTAADFVSISGSFDSTDNSGVFTVDALEDLALEGDETYTISVRTGSVSGTVRTSAAVLIVDDSSIPVTYSLTGSTSINEGSTGTFSAALTGVPANTTLYWTVNGTTADFTSISGSVLTTGDETTGAATFNVSAKADLTENTVTTPTLTVSSSASTLPASITSVAGPASVNEGSAATFTVATSNISDGTSLSWSVATNAGDFATASGTVTINSNAGTFTVTPDADTTTEGAETFTVTVSGGGATAKTSSTVTINDTSLSALTPTIVSVTGPTSVNEGSAATINVVTSDIIDGTTLTWTIASNAGDFTTSTGTFTVNSDAGTFTVTPQADATTEGAETFTVSVSGGGATTVTSSAITINDTSLTAVTKSIVSVTGPTSVNEGSAATINVVTTGFANGDLLTWAINFDGDSTEAEDFEEWVSGNLNVGGTTTINSNTASFPVTPSADGNVEGSETFRVFVVDWDTGTIFATSAAITINDTLTTTTTTTAAPATTTTTTTTAAPGSYSGTMAARWQTDTKSGQLIGIIDTDEWHDLDNGFTVNPQLGLADGLNTDVLLMTAEDTSGDTTGFTSITFTTAGSTSLTLTRATATVSVGGTGQVEWRWPDAVGGTAFEADLEQQWEDEGSPGALAGVLLNDQITITINY